jgi:AraC-like DNA-binding protein
LHYIDLKADVKCLPAVISEKAMRVQFEEIRPDADSSFRMLVTPRLNDFYFWHFHPEYEIVYIEAESGTRHVGEHLSRYEGSDLVFIGPHIPHLNFDYGVRGDYEEIVVQMREDFLDRAFPNIPELRQVQALFAQARHGVCFHGETRRCVGERLKRMRTLPRFEQFIEILGIFQRMATSTEASLLHPAPAAQTWNFKEQQRLRAVYQYIEVHYAERITLDQMAALTCLTKAAFCRYFRKMTRMTFVAFLNQYRISQAQKLLAQDRSVTEVCFACGFESLSYFTRTFRKVTGQNPLRFRKSMTEA